MQKRHSLLRVLLHLPADPCTCQSRQRGRLMGAEPGAPAACEAAANSCCTAGSCSTSGPVRTPKSPTWEPCCLQTPGTKRVHMQSVMEVSKYGVCVAVRAAVRAAYDVLRLVWVCSSVC